MKSTAAEELDGAEVSWHGLAGDRRWAFIRAGRERSGFPWLAIGEWPELAHYRPRFAEPDRPNASLTLVRTPSGEFDVATPRSLPNSGMRRALAAASDTSAMMHTDCNSGPCARV